MMISGAVADINFGHVPGLPQESNESVQELHTIYVARGQNVDDSENLACNAMATRSVGATTLGLNSVNEHFEETIEVDPVRQSEEPTIKEDRLALANEEDTFLLLPERFQWKQKPQLA